jgi:diadenosine tetraphosphate (Ap4A) HIT family hydrolase
MTIAGQHDQPENPAVCDVCGIAMPKPGQSQFIWSDGLWTATTRTRLPGWVNLQVTRHVEGYWNLNEEEAASFGPALVLMGRSIRENTGAERVYVYWMGEDRLHFRLHMAPRLPKSSADPRGEALHSLLMPLSRIDLWFDIPSREETSRIGSEIGKTARNT